jgi:hypothetical protein
VREAAQPGATCDLVFEPTLNTWKGNTNVELRIEDVASTNAE